MSDSKSNTSIMEKLLASQKQIKSISRNQEVEGEVVSFNDREITLDLGTKSEGVIPSREIGKEKFANLKIGDKIKAFVVAVENEAGQTILSSTYQIKQPVGGFKGRGPNWARFAQAQSQKSKLSGKVLEINKGGLIVEVEGTRGFLPNSQVGFELLSKSGKGMDDLIGQMLSITVIEIDQNNNRLIFTQRGQVTEEEKTKLAGFKKDDKLKGKIVAVLPFGLVIDVNGVEGLVFISDVSWDKVEDLTKLYNSGDEVDVLVTGSDMELGRLNLSIKQMLEDPFSKLVEKYPADEVVRATVLSVNDTGVVFELEKGIEGILPASKKEDGVVYEAGKSMQILIDSVDAKRRIINLAPFVTSTSDLIYK